VTKRLGIDSIDIPAANSSIHKPFRGIDLVDKVKEFLPDSMV
jgi:hypothetical protein